MSQYKSQTVQQIQDRIDPVQLVSKYVSLTLRGEKYWGLSPFKQEKTPSFCVDPVKKLYYCFSTSQGGDMIHFVQRMENTDFRGAIAYLAREYGIALGDNRAYEYGDSTKERLTDLCTRISKTFQYFFWNEEGACAHKYLAERGFNEQALKKFGVGYAPPDGKWLYDFLSKKGYQQQELASSGLFSKQYPRYSLFRDRVIFPICSMTGHTIGFGGRILGSNDSTAKYLNSSETLIFKKKQVLYGLYQSISARGFSANRKAYIVEGYLDVMALHQAGVMCTVAPLGTAFTQEQALVLRRHVDTVVLLFDSDAAGLNALLKSAIICERAEFSSIKVVELSHNDASDVLSKYGSLELQNQLLDEHEFFTYYANKIFPQGNASTQEKEILLRQILQYVVSIVSEYRRVECFARTADLFRVERRIIDTIVKEIFQKNQRQQRYQSPHNISRDVTETYIVKQEDISVRKDQAYPVVRGKEFIAFAALYSVLLDTPEYFSSFRQSVQLADLEDHHVRTMYMALEKSFREHGGTVHIVNVVSSLSYEFVQALQQTVASGELSTQCRDIVEQFKDELVLVRLKKRGKEIDYLLRITHAKDVGNVEFSAQSTKKIHELLEEKEFINKQIQNVQ